jgi:DNA invertase Pin-like site-specific DNA recombinase
MRPYVRTTPETRQRICDLYKAGKTLPQIAAETGFSTATVSNVVKAARIVGAGRTTGVRTDPATETLVMELYNQGITWREIMESASVTEHTVSAIIKRNGGEIGRKGAVTAEARKRIPVLYQQGIGAPEIGRIVGCHSSSVYAVLEEAGMDRRLNGCDNVTYFDQMDTPDKAYWLGFIGADGCVTGFNSGTTRLVIKLARKDRDHLVLLHKALKANRPIRDNEQQSAGQLRPYSTLAVYSPRLVEGLLAHGITARKSATLRPWDGPAHLMPHYWRGLVDGDGHITINGRGVYMGLLGSKPVADAFAAWVNDVAGTNVHATPKKPSTTAWAVQVGGTIRVLSLLAALYDDAPVALARKKALADLAVHGKPLQATLL